MNDRDPSLCAAHGCPCLGSMSTSTSGSNEWFCSYHFGRDAVAWQKITVALNRMRWLIETINKLRHAYSKGRDSWASAATTAKREMRHNLRDDLLPDRDEAGMFWIDRLDKAVQDACGAQGPAVQPPLPGVGNTTDTFQKASFSMPERAEMPA